jgi:SAM-dependent methyltransferase
VSTRPRAGGSRGRSLAADLARYYDLDMLDVTEDVDLYLQLATEVGGPVLELAAGTGRIAIPLARAGHRVVAVDIDPAMLARARVTMGPASAAEQGGSGALELVEADLTLFRSDERFGLVILALNSFMLLDDDTARAAALVTMRTHLRPGGVAVVDIVTPDDEEVGTYDGRLQLEWLRCDQERGELVTKLMSARIAPDGRSVELTQLFDVTPVAGGSIRRAVRSDVLHLISASELRKLALRAGFQRADLRGDHRLTRHGPVSPRALLIGRAV